MFSLRQTRKGFFALFLSFFLVTLWTGSSQAQKVTGGIVVSDQELATRAGMEILGRGGNAVDAAIATAFVLGVVDPASSGIGGGGFMVIYQTQEKKAHALDFRETAPAAAHRDLYMKDGQPVPGLSLTGPLAVAVPGEVAGLAEAWKRFGSLPWRTLLAPAIRYAAEGFPVDSHLHSVLERQLSSMRKFPELGRVFLKDGAAPAVGEKLGQPELGVTLKAIADRGQEIFYRGWIAQAIADRLKQEGGILTSDDLKNYKPRWREPILANYRKRVMITMPPPSSGGIALVQMLKTLETYPIDRFEHNSATYLHLLAEAMKHAFADRAQYLGDPDFVSIPVQKLLSNEHAAWIRGRVSSVRTHPPEFYGLAASQREKGGTTHFGVLDRNGNAVSCTLTINTQFGSKVLVPSTGIVLNNEMDDFSIHPGVPNVYRLVGAEANAIAPKKRPLSSMSPTILLEGDRPVLIVGASGGPRIISATFQAILNAMDFGMSVEKVVESPRIHHQWMPNEMAVEKGIPPGVREALERIGHQLREANSLGVVQAILVQGGKTTAAADPRK